MKMRRKKIKFTYLFFPLIGIVALQQNGICQSAKQTKLDSLRNKLTKDSAYIYRHRPMKFLFAIDKRNSFIHTNTKIPVSVGGIQLGVVIHEKHNLGLGFYTIAYTQKTHTVVDQNRTQYLHINMAYNTIFYEYSFLNTKRWGMSIPLEIGGGNYQITVTDSINKTVPGYRDTLKRNISVLGAGLNVDFKIWQWLGLNAMCGYRIVGGKEPTKMNFNGVFYSLGIQIYLGELMKLGRLGLKRRTYRNEVEKIMYPSNY